MLSTDLFVNKTEFEFWNLIFLISDWRLLWLCISALKIWKKYFFVMKWKSTFLQSLNSEAELQPMYKIFQNVLQLGKRMGCLNAL